MFHPLGSRSRPHLPVPPWWWSDHHHQPAQITGTQHRSKSAVQDMFWHPFFINKEASMNEIFLATTGSLRLPLGVNLWSVEKVTATGTSHASTSPPCGGNGTVGRLASSVPESKAMMAARAGRSASDIYLRLRDPDYTYVCIHT